MALVSLRPSTKSVTGLVIVAAVLLFGLVLAYMAAAGKLKGAAAELSTKERQVSESKEMAQKLEKTKLDYLDARSQLRCLESSVSTQAYVPTLLRQLEALGTSVNLKVLSVRPIEAVVTAQPVRKLDSGAQAAQGNLQQASGSAPAACASDSAKAAAPPYDEMKIDLELEGLYMNALDFLYRLTSFPKIVAVNCVQMSPAQRDAGFTSPLLNIKVSVSAFVFRSDEPVAEPSGSPQARAGAAANGRVRHEAG